MLANVSTEGLVEFDGATVALVECYRMFYLAVMALAAGAIFFLPFLIP